MVVSIKKILLTLTLIIFLFGGAMSKELTTSDRLDIIDVMSSFALSVLTMMSGYRPGVVKDRKLSRFFNYVG